MLCDVRRHKYESARRANYTCKTCLDSSCLRANTPTIVSGSTAQSPSPLPRRRSAPKIASPRTSPCLVHRLSAFAVSPPSPRNASTASVGVVGALSLDRAKEDELVHQARHHFLVAVHVRHAATCFRTADRCSSWGNSLRTCALSGVN